MASSQRAINVTQREKHFYFLAYCRTNIRHC